MLTDEYIKRVYDQVVARDGDQPEFLQAVREVFETLQPVVEAHVIPGGQVHTDELNSYTGLTATSLSAIH